MKISVILAIYNEDKYLEKCLLSLSEQKGVNFEVIVVDDGSWKPVNTKQLKVEGDKFKFFRIDHTGPAVARNFGVEKAKGEIVVFLDGDMEFEDDFLQMLTDPIVNGKSKGTFSTEEFVANWDNIWARCWNYENNLPTKRRINKNANMVKDFRAILKREFTRVKGFENTGYTDTWTLSEKLNYFPTPTKAKYYHYNPSDYWEVFAQAMWIGGRKRKFGFLGKIIAAARATAPVSLFVGLYKTVRYRELFMIKFKLLYDLGILGGIMNKIMNK